MKLYHYTSTRHLPYILKAGYLDVTESNIGSGVPEHDPYGEHVGPDVVWLTTSENPGHKQGLTTSADTGWPDKTEIRFTVDVPDALHWPKWSRSQGIDKRWARCLETDHYPEQWFVVVRRILLTECSDMSRIVPMPASV